MVFLSPFTSIPYQLMSANVSYARSQVVFFIYKVPKSARACSGRNTWKVGYFHEKSGTTWNMEGIIYNIYPNEGRVRETN